MSKNSLRREASSSRSLLGTFSSSIMHCSCSLSSSPGKGGGRTKCYGIHPFPGPEEIGWDSLTGQAMPSQQRAFAASQGRQRAFSASQHPSRVALQHTTHPMATTTHLGTAGSP